MLGGIILQALFGLLVLRSKFGYQLFKWIGDEVKKFLYFTNNGTKLVFGDKFDDHYFAMRVKNLIILFKYTKTVINTFRLCNLQFNNNNNFRQIKDS